MGLLFVCSLLRHQNMFPGDSIAHHTRCMGDLVSFVLRLEEGVVFGGKVLGKMATTLIWMPGLRRACAGHASGKRTLCISQASPDTSSLKRRRIRVKCSPHQSSTFYKFRTYQPPLRKSSRGSVDTTKTRSDPQRVRTSSDERPIGATKGKQPNTEAKPPPPPAV